MTNVYPYMILDLHDYHYLYFYYRSWYHHRKVIDNNCTHLWSYGHIRRTYVCNSSFLLSMIVYHNPMFISGSTWWKVPTISAWPIFRSHFQGISPQFRWPVAYGTVPCHISIWSGISQEDSAGDPGYFTVFMRCSTKPTHNDEQIYHNWLGQTHKP